MGGKSAPMPYQPKSEAAADIGYMSTLDQLSRANLGTFDTARTGYGQVYRNVLDNPYAASAQSGVDAAARALGAQGATNVGNAATLNAYAPALIQSGFDPQAANYNYGLRQALDLQKVANAQSGVAGSPFGAGLVGDIGATYTRGWQAEQASRQQQAIAALAALFGQSGELGGFGAQQQATAATMPEAQYLGNQQSILEALNALVQGTGAASAPVQADVDAYGRYLGIGQRATELGQQAVKIDASSGGLLGGLGSLFSLATGGGTTLGGKLLGKIGL